MRTGMLALAAWSCLALSAAFACRQDAQNKTELAREIDLPGYNGVRGDVHKPARITNADELAKAIPDKKWQATILKQVDFGREYLLFFAWAGSGQDKLTFTVGGRGIVPAVEFVYAQGRTEDLRSHFRLIAVARGLVWRFARPGDVRAIQGINAVAPENKRLEIGTLEELTRHFGETGAARILGQMDFATEKLVWVTWAGSNSEYLTHHTEVRCRKLVVVLTIVTPNPSTADLRPHGVLLVVPRHADWELGTPTRPVA